MRSLSASELLTIWESGWSARPFERALALLSAAMPGFSAATLAQISLGARDLRLLRLREWVASVPVRPTWSSVRTRSAKGGSGTAGVDDGGAACCGRDSTTATVYCVTRISNSRFLVAPPPPPPFNVMITR